MPLQAISLTLALSVLACAAPAGTTSANPSPATDRTAGSAGESSDARAGQTAATGQDALSERATATTGQTAATQQDARPGVAVFAFETGGSIGPDPIDMEDLGVGLQALLLTELRQNSALRIVERSQLNQILQEQSLTTSGQVDPSTAAEVGKLVGARYMIFGSVTDAFGEMVLTSRVVDVETSEILGSEQVRDNREELYDMLIQMADRVATSVDLPPLPEAEREEREEREVPPEAVVLLSRAEVAMDRGRTDRAIELYQQVTQEFPDYTEAQEALDQILTG